MSLGANNENGIPVTLLATEEAQVIDLALRKRKTYLLALYSDKLNPIVTIRKIFQQTKYYKKYIIKKTNYFLFVTNSAWMCTDLCTVFSSRI